MSNMLRIRQPDYKTERDFDVFYERKRRKSKKKSERLNARKGSSASGKLKRQRLNDKKNGMLGGENVRPRKWSVKPSVKRNVMIAELQGRRSAANVKKRERLEGNLATNVGNIAPDPGRETDHAVAIEIVTTAEAAGVTVASEDVRTLQGTIEGDTNLKR